VLFFSLSKPLVLKCVIIVRIGIGISFSIAQTTTVRPRAHYVVIISCVIQRHRQCDMCISHCSKPFLPCDAMHKCGLSRCRCPSVCHVRVFRQNKHIFKFVSQSSSHGLVFPYHTLMSWMPVGRQKLWFSTNIYLRRVLSTVWPPSVIHTAAPDRGKLVELFDYKHRRLLFSGDREMDDKVFITRSLNIMSKTAEQTHSYYGTLVESWHCWLCSVIYCAESEAQ